jgi:hypothetical protein
MARELIAVTERLLELPLLRGEDRWLLVLIGVLARQIANAHQISE